MKIGIKRVFPHLKDHRFFIMKVQPYYKAPVFLVNSELASQKPILKRKIGEK